jgi:hypothetical protein
MASTAAPAVSASSATSMPPIAAAARRANDAAAAEVTYDSMGHEVFKTKGVGGTCVAHDYHFV